jgi:hypothetical protein
VEDISAETLIELASIENEQSKDDLKDIYDRLYKLEKTMASVLSVLKRIVSHSSVKNLPYESNQ